MPARRPVSRSSRGKNKSPRVQEDETTPLSNISTSAAEESFQDIDFLDFFGDGSQPLTVELYRDRPKYVGEVAVNGFCEALPPGVDLQYIKDAYGGGRFRVMQRDAAGKVTKQRYFDVAGSPLMPSVGKASESDSNFAQPDRDGDGAGSLSEPVTHVEGIPITGILAKDIEIIKSVMLMKSVLHEANPNDRMIELLLERQKNPDLLGTLKDVAPLIGAIKEVIGEFSQQEAASGSNFIDLAREALKAFGQYAKLAPRPKPVTLPVAPQASPPAQIPEAPSAAELETDKTLQSRPESHIE